MNWLIKSFLVMFAYGALLVLFSFIQKNFNIPPRDQFVIYFAGAGIGVLLVSRPWTNASFNFSNPQPLENTGCGLC
jgi:hypothetical protein